MPRFDPEIIAALADGSLPANEAAAVQARIDRDPAARNELALQRIAVSAIRDTATPRLTDDERGALRAGIAAELNLATATDSSPAPRRVAWGAIGVAAATLAALVVAVPIAGLLGTGGDDAVAVSFAGDTTQPASDDGIARVGTPPTGDATPEPTLGFAGPTSADAPGETLARGGTDATTTTDDAVLEVTGAYALADDLMLIRSDPDALKNLGEAVAEETPCRVEAVEILGSEDLRFFPYADEEVAESGDILVRDYIVYFIANGEDRGGSLVAFAHGDCTASTEIP